MFQYTTLVTHFVSYVFQPGVIILTVTSREVAAMRAAVSVMDGYQLKVVVAAP